MKSEKGSVPEQPVFAEDSSTSGESPPRPGKGVTRRQFLGSSATLAGGAALFGSLPVEASAWVAGSDRLKVSVIGSGARGTGAAVQCLRTDGPVELVAMADIFEDILENSYQQLIGLDEIRDSVNVPEDHKFVGLDSYRHAIELADVVLLAAPPAFRPLHYRAAVEAGKHVFLEKALATDSPGVRSILESGKMAEEKGLKVLVGLQNRYNIPHIELVKRVRDGMIGDVVAANTEYLIGFVTHHPRREGQTELEYQLRNWRYFNWLWGGAPAGLNIHHTDIVHWVKDSWPVQAHATGGRGALDGPEYGDIFDNYSIEYRYEDGTKCFSPVRVIDGCRTNTGFYLQGTRGRADLRRGIEDLSGETIWRHRGRDDPDPYQREIDILFRAIRNDEPLNDTEWGAKSTMTSIMGRMAAHSGQAITWEDAMESERVLVPELHSFEDEAPVLPFDDGTYPVPVPGRTEVL